ncbi:MAG: response regulator [Opitutaceae bacterium]|nr:response regulator [Cytophagales bacterium]
MKRKVLIVDDSRPMLALLSGMLKMNYDIVSKQSAVAALETLKEGYLPDLIITDINMPEMDGFDFITGLKDSAKLAGIPILVLSGLQTSADRLKLYKLGIDDYISKPFNPEEMTLRVDKLINKVSMRVSVN